MRVIVVAKAPIPGRVKTRLCPPLSPAQAASIAAAALADTLAAVDSSRATARVLALAGPAGDLTPPGWCVIPQRGESFGDRLANAWQDAGGPALQIGMDTPQVTPDELNTAMAHLSRAGSVLGMAADGGWWALGLQCADARVFADVPMSTPTTGAAQQQRLIELGLDPVLLGTLRDVDTWEDARAVATAAPSTLFADEVGRVSASLAAGALP